MKKLYIFSAFLDILEYLARCISNLVDKFTTRNKNYEENMEDVVIECLEYFGDIKSVDYDEDSNAVELWFSYEEEPHVAYLFGYDEGVVLCK